MKKFGKIAVLASAALAMSLLGTPNVSAQFYKGKKIDFEVPRFVGRMLGNVRGHENKVGRGWEQIKCGVVESARSASALR